MLFNNEENPDVDYPYASEMDYGDTASYTNSLQLTDTAKFGLDTLNMDTEKKQNNNDDIYEDASLADSSLMSSSMVSTPVSPALQRYLATSSSLPSLSGSNNKNGRFYKV